MFRCGKEKGDDQLLHFKEFDSAEGIEVGFLGIVDPPVPPPPAAISAAAAVIPDGMQAYVIPHGYDLPPSFSRQHHLYPVAARASLVGGLQQQHCKELFLQQLAGQVHAARPMHLLHRFHGFFFREEEEEEATARKAGFTFSPLLSPPRNATSSFYSTAAAHYRQPQTAVSYGIHTYVVMEGVGGFNGPLLRDSSNGRCELINLSRGGGRRGVVASRFDVLQDAVAATRCGYCCRGKEHSLDLHHLVSREASGVPTLLSRLNAKSLLQLLTIQAANWCRKLGSPSAAPPLLLTYQIYYSLVAMQNMVFQSSSEVTDLLELWQSTFEADIHSSSSISSSINSINSSCVPHEELTAAIGDDCDPFMCVVSDLLTWHFCLTVSKAHLTLRERQLRGAHTCSGRRRKRVYRCSMHYFDVDIDCSCRDLTGGSSIWPHRFQASGDSMSTAMVPGEGKEEEEAAIRYIRKHRALLNLDFVWAFCGAKGYKSAAREVLLVSACSLPASSSLRGYLDQLFRQGCAPVRLDCLMESMEAIAERSRVVLCALMLHMGSILGSNRQLGVQLLLHLFPYVGPQAARMEIFRSRGLRGERGSCLLVTEGGARDVVRDSSEVEGGAADPSMTSNDDDAYLNALEAFHEYATGLLHSDRAVIDSCCHVSSQLLWLEASLLLGSYHRRHHHHLHQSIVISTGHYRRVLDLLLCSPVSALHHSPAAESTAQLCLQHGFFEGVAAVTGRWLESILGETELLQCQSQCLQEQEQQPSNECDAVSRFEHAIVTIHLLTRKNNHYSDAAGAHHRPLQSMQQVQAMLEAVQRCIPHLLSKLVFDLEAAAAADPLGGQGSLHCEEVQQQLVQLLRLCWKVSIIASAAAAAAVEDSCGGSREVGVLVEIALEAIVLANTNTPATRLGDTTLPPSIVRRAFDSIRLAAATRFRAYVVRELLVVGRRGSDGGPHTGCDAAAVMVELLGRSIGAESLLDVIESEPALSRCLDYSMIERLRF